MKSLRKSLEKRHSEKHVDKVTEQPPDRKQEPPHEQTKEVSKEQEHLHNTPPAKPPKPLPVPSEASDASLLLKAKQGDVAFISSQPLPRLQSIRSPVSHFFVIHRRKDFPWFIIAFLIVMPMWQSRCSAVLQIRAVRSLRLSILFSFRVDIISSLAWKAFPPFSAPVS